MNKKIYWGSFALQLILSILAFFCISILPLASLVALCISLIWCLCWLPVHRKKFKENKNKQLRDKIFTYIVIAIILLQFVPIYSPNLGRLVDSVILLHLNFCLIADDIIIWLGNKKDQDI